jgi:hypothetical protein
VKPVNQKHNRLERLDLIMADQEALGMNEETATPKAVSGTNGHTEHERAQARQLLHYLTDEIGSGNESAAMPGGDAEPSSRKAGC